MIPTMNNPDRFKIIPSTAIFFSRVQHFQPRRRNKWNSQFVPTIEPTTSSHISYMLCYRFFLVNNGPIPLETNANIIFSVINNAIEI